MLDLQELKRYELRCAFGGMPMMDESKNGAWVRYSDHLAVVESLRTELNHSTMAADAEARFADEMKAERDALRKQLEEKSEELSFAVAFSDNAGKELSALRSSRDADIERAVEICNEIGCKHSMVEGTYAAGKKAGAFQCADALAQVKEQGNG